MYKKLIAIALIIFILPIAAPAEGSTYTRLELGAYGKAVEALQERLIELGYLRGEADGSYWTQTKRAIMAFQQTNFLPVTEKYIDEQTQELLFSANAQPPLQIVVQQGEKSDNVLLMQQCLYEWGFTGQTPDGVYGSSTAEAVADFQNVIWSRIWKERNPYMDYANANFVTDGSSVDANIFQYFIDKSYVVQYEDLKIGDKGPDVGRIQNVLYEYNYLWRKPDNAFDGFTQAAVTAFQKAHGLPATGIADEETQALLMSKSGIIACEKVALPYRLVVDVDKQRVFVYAWDGEGYTSLVREMICSTGTIETPTPVGIFNEKTGPMNRWHKFRAYNCWAEYSYIIEGGIMFHSVLYYNRVDPATGEQTHGYLDQSSVDNLGTRQSHGCVRLPVEDAQWIFFNCPRNTEVEIIQLNPDPVVETEEA